MPVNLVSRITFQFESLKKRISILIDSNLDPEMNSSLPTMQPGDPRFNAFACFNQAIANAQMEIQQRAFQQAAMENVDVMRPIPLMQLPMPQMPLPAFAQPPKPKEIEVLRARPLPTENTMMEPRRQYVKMERAAMLPTAAQEQSENDSLMVQLEHLERESRVTKHKHRKGTTCPRCKVDQSIKRLKKRMAKGKGSTSGGAAAPAPKRDYENRPQAKNVKASGFLPTEAMVEMSKELAKVEAMTAHLDFHSMDSDLLARTVFELERETFMLKHRHFKGITCPKCKIEHKAKTARKVLLSRKSLQRKRKRTEGLLFFDMVHNGAISGLAALADIAELAS